MPVSIWLNGNAKRMSNKEWMRLVLDVERIFQETFEFEHERLQLWDKSFFSESDGTLVISKPFQDLNDSDSFESNLKQAIDYKLILKITGRMKSPIDARAFFVCFLESKDRWGMPHMFFDSEMGEQDLTDSLWKDNSRNAYVYRILDDLPQIRVNVLGETRRIIDRALIARDFPDKASIKEKGIIMYYLSGRETRFLNNMIRDYSAAELEKRKKISELNVNEMAGRLYEDEVFRKQWEKISPTVKAIPGGSLSLISETEEGIPILLSGIEKQIISPVLDEVPKDLLEGAVERAKNKMKLSQSSYQQSKVD